MRKERPKLSVVEFVIKQIPRNFNEYNFCGPHIWKQWGGKYEITCNRESDLEEFILGRECFPILGSCLDL